MFALAAGLVGGTAASIQTDTVERAGDNARRSSLSHATHAGENESMSQTAAGDGVGEDLDHNLLADEISKRLGAVFSR